MPNLVYFEFTIVMFHVATLKISYTPRRSTRFVNPRLAERLKLSCGLLEGDLFWNRRRIAASSNAA
jgi:hypothetical protein